MWRMTLRLLAVVVALAVPSSALAAPHLLEPSDVQLADYHGAAPVNPVAPVRPVRPLAPAPVMSHSSGSLFLIGLGLAAGGLVLGGAGFTVLYLCRTGTACAGDAATTVGWVLAAPGVIPLAVGLVMMWLGSGSSMRVQSPAVNSGLRWAFGFTPLRDGGFVSAGTAF